MAIKPTIKNFQQAEQFLGKKSDRPLECNTRLIRLDDNTIVVRHHRTDIVTYYKHRDDVLLNNGGWYSDSTKERMNRYTTVSIHRYRFQWYVNGTEPKHVWNTQKLLI
jgi:hypothetical protein